jgi:biotin operon repressor
MLLTGLRAVTLLSERAYRPEELGEALGGLSRRTVERLLAGIRAAGVRIDSERTWREVRYRIAPGDEIAERLVRAAKARKERMA